MDINKFIAWVEALPFDNRKTINMLSAKEKANELIEQFMECAFYEYDAGEKKIERQKKFYAKQCALICVEQERQLIEKIEDSNGFIKGWREELDEVESAIEKM